MTAGFGEIQPAHHSVLQHLQNEGIRLSEIARRAMLTKQTISQSVRYLEQRGYPRTTPAQRAGQSGVESRERPELEAVAEHPLRALENEWREALGAGGYRQLRTLPGRITVQARHEYTSGDSR